MVEQVSYFRLVRHNADTHGVTVYGRDERDVGQVHGWTFGS
jgi:hypothetical protein